MHGHTYTQIVFHYCSINTYVYQPQPISTLFHCYLHKYNVFVFWVQLGSYMNMYLLIVLCCGMVYQQINIQDLHCLPITMRMLSWDFRHSIVVPCLWVSVFSFVNMLIMLWYENVLVYKQILKGFMSCLTFHWCAKLCMHHAFVSEWLWTHIK